MSYREWIGSNGFPRKEWRDDAGEFHREDGPAHICYNIDGKILLEHFYLKGNYLGSNKKGFWALWERLTEVERQAPDLLKCLARYS